MNTITKEMIKFLKTQKEGYEKRGLIPTLDLLIEDLEKPRTYPTDEEIDAMHEAQQSDHEAYLNSH